MDKERGVTVGTPEDLSLDGSLSAFFTRKGITFDMETGLFRVVTPLTNQIRLIGDGQKFAMVRKALQRNGIQADRDVQSDICIDTRGDGTNYNYMIQTQRNGNITVKNIEALLDKVKIYIS